MFGAGGGTLTLQLQAMQFAPGQTIYGVATFTGGKRPQNITNIVVRVTMTETHHAPPGKPAPAPTTVHVVPDQMVTGAFQVQAGAPHQFQFALQLPAQLKPEIKGQIDYRVGASADIPGEIDQHASADIQIVGGGIGMQQPMMQQPMMQKPGMFEMGQGVFAEHPKVGGWHPGRVVALQNGMIGVDWADPKLGESSWLQPHQVQHGK
jgi:sporulation-control protein spo0M